MDSFRLTINNYDLSTSNIEQAEDLAGFTVIKAPKGPITPVRIPSAGTAKIQDIFGVASTDYPELYEAINFNNEYDLYISAPYTKAQVPVAYVTAQGIFPAEELMDYNTSVENFINGISDEINLPSSTTLLVDSRYPINNLGIDHINGTVITYNDLYDKQAYPGSGISARGDGTKGIVVETGLYYKEFTGKTFRIKNLPSSLNGKEYIKDGVIDLTFKLRNSGETSPNYVDVIWTSGNVAYPVGSLVFLNAEGKYEDLPLTLADGSYTQNTPCVIKINGQSSVDSGLCIKYIGAILDEKYLKKLRTFWLEDITSDKIRGAIFPKYPSARKLNISFARYNEYKGYSSLDVSSRNTLKMTAYEDGAFHDSTHPVEIVGSLDITAKDANGSYIGFSSSNGSYADQDLVCVYSVNNTGFTDADKDDFRKISGHPAIILEGGIKEFNVINEGVATESYDSTALHNLGWAEAANEEYSEVALFFDPCTYESDPSINNTFFTLSNIHPLSGYIFNYTLPPTSVKESVVPLAYGERYWNVCNEDIVVLSNNSKIISSMVGARSLMQCRIIKYAFGGADPMYLNTGTPGMGGQLSIPGHFKLKYKYTTEQQRILDELNFNPVIQDHSYGVMVVGQKTCKPGAVTDWSYIGHVCSFLDFQRDVRSQVMIPQLGKANNAYYRDLRREQVLSLLEKRTVGPDSIWAEASVDTSTADGVNDIQAQRARQFRILVRVKVSTFSEYVILDFTNVDQGMEV